MLCPCVGTAGLPWYSLFSQLSKYAVGIQGSILTWKKDSWESMTGNEPRLPKDPYNLEYTHLPLSMDINPLCSYVVPCAEMITIVSALYEVVFVCSLLIISRTCHCLIFNYFSCLYEVTFPSFSRVSSCCFFVLLGFKLLYFSELICPASSALPHCPQPVTLFF